MALVLTKPWPQIFTATVGRYVLPFALLLLGAVSLRNYIADSYLSLFAAAIAIAATLKKERPVKRRRFALVALLFIGLIALVPVHTVLFFAVAFALFFWVEIYFGAVSWMGVVALFVSSPAFQYASNVFSFPLRLQLAKAAGLLFSFFDAGVKVNANTIVHGGQEFAVDPACAGLHLFSLSLLLGIALLGLLQRKGGRVVSWKPALLYLLSLVALNLFANLLRIVLLVQFAVAQESVLHDAIGLFCLLVYVCVPACWLAKRLVTKAPLQGRCEADAAPKTFSILQVVLMPALLVAAQRVESVDTYARFDSKYAKVVEGYASSVYAQGILKLENRRSLVYVKFIRGFYDTEHNPTLCWSGSGYNFEQTQKRSIGGREVYTALLRKGSETLYTAWWYGNESKATVSQWDWRIDMLQGEGYAVINVTAASEAEREAALKEWLLTPKLKPLFED